MDSARGLDPADAGQVHVHQDELRHQDPCHFERVLTAGGLADDLEAVSRLDHGPRRSPKRFDVVDDQNPDGHDQED